MVSESKGLRVRGSITSASVPSLASLAAAERALDRSANREAASYVERTFSLLELVPEEERASLALTLHLTHANALMFSRGIGAPETVASLQEANRYMERGVGTEAQRMFLMHAFGTVEYIDVMEVILASIDGGNDTRDVQDARLLLDGGK